MKKGFRPLTRIHLLLTLTTRLSGRMRMISFRPLTRIHLLLTKQKAMRKKRPASFRPLTRIHLLLTCRKRTGQNQRSVFPTSDEDSSTPDVSFLLASNFAFLVSDL